jgi:UDP-N-acetylmuramoyl-tripeptide--D-alanyl-D-alanine ligase
MILAFLLFVYLFFIPHLIKRVFEQIYLWQIKEYRWDRMRVFLLAKSFFQTIGKATIFAFFLSLAGMVLLSFMEKRWLYMVLLIGFSYYVHSSLVTLTSVLNKSYIKPRKSIRNLLIFTMVLVLSLIPIYRSLEFYSILPVRNDGIEITSEPANVISILPSVDERGITTIPLDTATITLFFCNIFAFDLLIPVIISGLVFLTSILSLISKKWKINKAKRKISNFENLKIIGITGSYGKTTTKEILHMILSRKFKTYSTPKSVNTDIGVAMYILENLGLYADVFIAEMGAYKRGEIKAICDIAEPDIVVMTAISDQHLALFGSIEETLSAKYEIVEHSKPDAKVIMNADDTMVLRVAGKSKKTELLYSTKKEVDLWASDIKSKKDRVEFNLHYKDKTKRVEVRMLGEYNVSNVLAAVGVALNLGMSIEVIIKALKEGSKTKQIGKMLIKKSRYGYRVIDDSYNSNSAGFSASLEFLDNMKGNRKVLVSIGIIELGENRKEVYKNLSKKIVRVCDTVVTTDEELRDSLIKTGKDIEIVFDTGVKKQLHFLKNKVGMNDIVLFEGPNQRLIEEILR